MKAKHPQQKAANSSAPTCPSAPAKAASNLSWLLHRATQVFGAAISEAMSAEGVDNMRDYVVLSALSDGVERTQLVLGAEVGLDKTTLTSVIDRLERMGLVTRRIDPKNRRARFPEITSEGRAVCTRLEVARERVEASLLQDIPTDMRAALPQLLMHLIAKGEGSGVAVKGSCV